MKNVLTIFFLLFFIVACQNKKQNSEKVEEKNVFHSPLGKQLPYPTPSEKMLAQFDAAKQAYENETDNPEKIIWHGRRTAYLGKYTEAINIYSEGIDKFPDNPKF